MGLKTPVRLKPDCLISTKWTLVLLKVSFKKRNPRVLNHCKCKFYDNHIFREQSLTKLNHNNVSKQENNLKEFQQACLIVLNWIAPIKHQFKGAKQKSFMNKELQHAIMIRSKLTNKFIENSCLCDKNAYDKQRSTCASLLRKTKKQYYLNLNVKNIVDNKRFYKPVSNIFNWRKQSDYHL